MVLMLSALKLPKTEVYSQGSAPPLLHLTPCLHLLASGRIAHPGRLMCRCVEVKCVPAAGAFASQHESFQSPLFPWYGERQCSGWWLYVSLCPSSCDEQSSWSPTVNLGKKQTFVVLNHRSFGVLWSEFPDTEPPGG